MPTEDLDLTDTLGDTSDEPTGDTRPGADPRDAEDDSPPPVLPGMPLTSDPTHAPVTYIRASTAPSFAPFDPFDHVKACSDAWDHAEALGKTEREKWAAVVCAVVESLGLAS